MAIFFTSPRKHQRKILAAMAALALVAVGLVSLAIFPPSTWQAGSNVTAPPTTTNPNLGLPNSDQVHNLQTFDGFVVQFSYRATDKSRRAVTGLVAAHNRAEAQSALEAQGLTVASLEEATAVGRSDPFSPY